MIGFDFHPALSKSEKQKVENRKLKWIWGKSGVKIKTGVGVRVFYTQVTPLEFGGPVREHGT